MVWDYNIVFHCSGYGVLFKEFIVHFLAGGAGSVNVPDGDDAAGEVNGVAGDLAATKLEDDEENEVMKVFILNI